MGEKREWSHPIKEGRNGSELVRRWEEIEGQELERR
jgi:hypothetical protein